MERYTKRWCGNVELASHVNEDCATICRNNICENCMIQKAFNKLAEYEDLEEQGYLYRLPIALGAPCYVIEKCSCGLHYDCRENNRARGKTKALIISEKNNPKTARHVCVKLFERPFKVDYIKKLGKTVFATFEEAREKAEAIEW